MFLVASLASLRPSLHFVERRRTRLAFTSHHLSVSPTLLSPRPSKRPSRAINSSLLARTSFCHYPTFCPDGRPTVGKGGKRISLWAGRRRGYLLTLQPGCPQETSFFALENQRGRFTRLCVFPANYFLFTHYLFISSPLPFCSSWLLPVASPSQQRRGWSQ